MLNTFLYYQKVEEMTEFRFEPNHFRIILSYQGNGNMTNMVGHELDNLFEADQHNCLDLLTGIQIMLERSPDLVEMPGGAIRMLQEVVDRGVDFTTDPDLDAISERLADNVLPFKKKKLN